MFLEVAPPGSVVIKSVSSPLFEVIRTFEGEGDPAVVGWRQQSGTAAEYRRVATIAVEANGQNLDRLAAEVAEAS